MLQTLAVIGGLAILAWFIRAIGLKRISIEFDKNVTLFRRRTIKNEKPPKQLSQ